MLSSKASQTSKIPSIGAFWAQPEPAYYLSHSPPRQSRRITELQDGFGLEKLILFQSPCHEQRPHSMRPGSSNPCVAWKRCRKERQRLCWHPLSCPCWQKTSVCCKRLSRLVTLSIFKKSPALSYHHLLYLDTREPGLRVTHISKYGHD